MLTSFAVRALSEFSVILLLIYGFIREDKVIAFERSVKRIVVGNTRRFIRLRERRRAGESRIRLQLREGYRVSSAEPYSAA